MIQDKFVHLHLHSEYSLVDGIIRIEELVDYAATHNFPSIALTDNSNLFGLIKFYRLARAKGIKPIVGSEIKIVGNENKSAAPIVLLVKNKKGYTNLTKLVSKAYIEGQNNGEPLVKIEWLEEFSEGLIALSGGQKGPVGRALLSNNLNLAKKRIDYFTKIFGEDFFIEIQRVDRENEEEYNLQAIKIASEKNLAVVATNDVRFLRPIDPDDESPSDYEVHEARVSIQQGEVLSNSSRSKEYLEGQYLSTGKEMIEKFYDLPEAIENTLLISKKCNLELELGHFYLPEFEVPGSSSTKEYLEKKSNLGLEKRFKEITNSVNAYKIDKTIYKERLNYELEMICKLGFEGYFLIVADFVNWAQEKEIPVGPGRGSGAGSITAYALGITAIDPIKYELLFERFLNPDRVSNPDFDIDFCIEGRDKVLEYVTKKYGKDSVAQISTRGTMAARAVLRDVARVLGKPYAFGDRLAKAIPGVLGITLKEAYKEKEFKELIDSSEESKEVFEMSLKLEGLSRSVGTHAAGVVIAPTALTDFTPLIVDQEKGTVATQFDMGDVESAGLVKFDFLGLKTLTVIRETVNRINKKNNQDKELVDINNIPLDDSKTFKLLQKGETTGVFQLESRGMKEYLKQLEPNNFEDIVSMNALYRPGALGMNMVDSYIDRKHGREEVTYGHESVKKILGTTYGVIVYQEQVMQIAQELSGFSLGQADILRRAMGKKKKDEMEKMREEFIEGAARKKVNRLYSENLFDQIEKFAGYGFNRCHSVPYALIAYQTAWLKAHYPSEFMASVLSSELDSTDRIQMFVDDCRSIGLKVEKPDINKSSYTFEDLNSGNILYGLGAIKGIGESLVNQVIQSRKNKSFLDLYDFCLRVGFNRVNKRILTTLIGSGAMDSLGKREILFNQINPILKKVEQVSERSHSQMQDFFGDESNEHEEKEQKESISKESFDILSHEWSALGFYLESHPIENRKDEARNMCGLNISELEEGSHSQRVAGMLMHLNVRQGRHGRYAFGTLDDSTGRLEVSIWSDAFDAYRSVLKKGQVIVIEGIVEKDSYFSNSNNPSYKILAERILTFNQARSEYLRHIKLNVSTKQNIEEITSELKKLSSNGSGSPIIISYKGSIASADIELPEDFSIIYDDATQKILEELFGSDNVDLVYHARPYIH